MDPLTRVQQERLATFVTDLVHCDQLSVEIQYITLRSSTYAVETGVTTRTEGDSTVRALRHIVDVDEAERSGGKLQVEDRLYMIAKEDIAVAPTTSDNIVDANETFEVVSWEEDPLGAFYQFLARRV